MDINNEFHEHRAHFYMNSFSLQVIYILLEILKLHVSVAHCFFKFLFLLSKSWFNNSKLYKIKQFQHHAILSMISIK